MKQYDWFSQQKYDQKPWELHWMLDKNLVKHCHQLKVILLMDFNFYA